MLAFLLVAAAVICTPGQDTALTVRNALAGGRRSGVATAVGVALGNATWAVAAAAGVVAVLRASEPAFHALRLAGAAYLVLLGLQSVAASLRRRTDPSNTVLLGRGVTVRRALRQGLLSNLGNAKVAVFFTSLLPQVAGRSFASLLAFGLAFSVMTLTWLSAYAVAVARAHALLLRTRVRRALDALLGTVLVAFGVRLAAER